MAFTSLVAASGLSVVDAELASSACNVALGHVGKGTEEGNAGEGAHTACLTHGIDELGTAVGIDGVVAAVVGHHDVLQSGRLGHADGDGEHDAVAEGYHGGLHVLLGIVVSSIFATKIQFFPEKCKCFKIKHYLCTVLAVVKALEYDTKNDHLLPAFLIEYSSTSTFRQCRYTVQ